MAFIRSLQEKEEYVRRRWLFVLTGVSMAIVIGAWFAFFQLGASRTIAPDQLAAAQPPRAGIGKIFAAGVSVTAQELSDLTKSVLATISSPFRKTTDITIERPPQMFQIEALPPIPPTPLP